MRACPSTTSQERSSAFRLEQALAADVAVEPWRSSAVSRHDREGHVGVRLEGMGLARLLFFFRAQRERIMQCFGVYLVQPHESGNLLLHHLGPRQLAKLDRLHRPQQMRDGSSPG